MNKTFLSGRLTRDPEQRQTQAGQAVASFTLAVDKKLSRDKKQEAESQGKPTADFIKVTAWGMTADMAIRYLSKGSQCIVEGRIQTGSYKDKDGKTVYTTDVIADSIEFIGSKSDGQQKPSNKNDFFEEVQDGRRIPF